MDRFGIRPVALCMLAGTVVGAAASALATGPEAFLVGQLMLGIATSGMLMCPMTLAAKQMSAARFGLWSGMILSVGNIGMLLSSSPLAWVIEQYGWRAGFWVSAVFGLLVAIAVFALVPKSDPAHTDNSSPLSQMAEVMRLGLSRPLRGVIALALVSLAAALVLRGLWGGPWLMDVKGLSRIEAGHDLGLFTLAFIVGPRSLGFSTESSDIAADAGGSHLLAAMAADADCRRRAASFRVKPVRRCRMPPLYDVSLLVLFGLAISAQPLLFGMTRQLTDPQNAGKALSAINLAFFLGAALMQSATGMVAAALGSAGGDDLRGPGADRRGGGVSGVYLARLRAAQRGTTLPDFRMQQHEAQNGLQRDR